MKEFLAKLNKKDGILIINMFYIFFVMGIYVLMIGSILPMMKEEYNLSYEVSGFILSVHNLGNMIAGLLAGVITMVISIKRSFILSTAIAAIGFIATLLTGNPIILLTSFALTGIGRGVGNNYANLTVSTIGGGKSAPNNMLHSCFAIGAVLSPFIVLMLTKNSPGRWKIVVIIVAVLLVISILLSIPMDMSAIEYDKGDRKADRSFRFVKDKRFLLPTICMFFYQCVEATLMGWMVTYFVESGFVSQSFSQTFSSILWIAILAGRLICVAVANRLHSPQLVKVLSLGMLAFSVLLLFTNTFALAIIATIGLGLSASGMFGTIMACAGDVFPQYTFAMSAFIAVAGAGASAWPAVVGLIAGAMGMRAGMGSILIPGVLLVIAAFINYSYFAKRKAIKKETV
ncbi:MAG: MFS transporter [Lachnospiraceae bacterium]|nr:MFS transporter [Lachnospiraceae bacterium]